MPILRGPSGSAAAAGAATLLVGTATVAAAGAVAVDGTATTDGRELSTWRARRRRTRVRVVLGAAAEDVRALSGSVDVTRDGDSPTATLSFSLRDRRLPFYAGTLGRPGQPVEVRVRIATPSADAETVVFRGVTESAPNSDPYRPVAKIQAASSGTDWTGAKGCLTLPAFSGSTRLEVLKALAESCGIDASRIRGGETWKRVRLPLNLSGVSPWELARRFAELEGSYVRVTDDALEILPEASVVGPLASPVFDFEPGNYLSVAEAPPSRPVTRWTLSANVLPDDFLTAATRAETLAPEIAGGEDADGNRFETIRTVQTVGGAIVEERLEEWGTTSLPGVTPSAPAYRLNRLTLTRNRWRTVTIEGVSVPTAQLVDTTTTVSEFYSPPCAVTAGYAWDDDTRHLEPAPSWRVVSESVTTYTYAAAPGCSLEKKETRTGGWYAPASPAGAHTYTDGTKRILSAYAWRPRTDPQPLSTILETYDETSSGTSRRVTVADVRGGWIQTTGEGGLPSDAWGIVSQAVTTYRQTIGSGIVSEAGTTIDEKGNPKYYAKSYAGTLPEVPRASSDVPQYATEPAVLVATAATGAPVTDAKAETVFDAEAGDELETVAARRFRDDLSPRETILHPALPLLRLFDPVTVLDPARGLFRARGYVENIRPRLDPLNGALRQETTVVIPPPELYP